MAKWLQLRPKRRGLSRAYALQMLYSLLGHKHGRKHLTTYTASILFLMVSILPSNALAFETSLDISPTPEFISDLKDFSPNDLMPEIGKQLPVHDFTSAALVSAPSPITEEAQWNKPAVRKVVAEKIRPTLDAPVVMEGEASYYSRAGCLGCDANVIMANGQPLNDNALTMAIGADKKHLVGYQAKVTSLATGKSVVVRITDTGGFYQAKYGYRIADLTIATKQAIGMKGGVGQVRVEVF